MINRKTGMKAGHIFILSIILFLSGSCATKIPHSIMPDYQDKMPTSIAVLPVQNETTDMDAGGVFRPRLYSIILSKGYATPAVAGVDSLLAQKDIREAGQLGSMTPLEIGELLNVDALLYATVTEWSTTCLVVYSSVKVGARFQLIDARTGGQLWESEHEVAEKKFGLDSDDMVDNLSFAALQGYEPYVMRLINMTFSTLPNGPRYVPSKGGRGCLGP